MQIINEYVFWASFYQEIKFELNIMALSTLRYVFLIMNHFIVKPIHILLKMSNQSTGQFINYPRLLLIELIAV